MRSHWIVGLTALLGCSPIVEEPVSTRPTMIWTQRDPAGARSRPFADDDLAVFEAGFSARIVALDAQSGARRWSRDLSVGTNGLSLPQSNILSVGDVIVAPALRLYGLDRATGAVRWSFQPDSEYAAGSDMALSGTTLITPGTVRLLFALDARTGAPLWTTDLRERPFSPVVDRGVVYVGTGGYFGPSLTLGAGHAVALEATSGHILWSTPLPDEPGTPYRGGASAAGALTPDLYVVASNSGRVYGLNRVDGSVRWTFNGGTPSYSGVALFGTLVVVADLRGAIFGLDAATGVKRWQTSTNGTPNMLEQAGSSVTTLITADSSCAYISVGGVLCVDATGQIRWDIGGFSNGGPSYTTPVLARGSRLFIGSQDGFHALTRP